MITKEALIDLIEDYAAAKASGRPGLIRATLPVLDAAINEIFAEKPKKEKKD